MSQNDYTIANQGFPGFRSDLNQALQAIATNNSGATAPSTTFANMWWYETDTGIMYIRNQDNDAWIKFAELDQTNDKFILSGTLQLDDGTVSAPALGFNSDTNMGLYRGGTDILRFVTAGVDRLQISADGSISTPTLGTSNFRAGVNAGNSIIIGGNYNVFVGDESGTATTSGDSNVGVGYSVLETNVSGLYNTAVGHQALKAYTGSANTAVGYNALLLNSTGSENTAVGYLSLDANLTGNYNTAFGRNSLSGNTTANHNTAIGRLCMHINQTGANNTAVGSGALQNNSSGSDHVAIGINALSNNETANINTAVGNEALKLNTTGWGNLALGPNTLDANLTGIKNIAVGGFSLSTNQTGSSNTAVGYNALVSNLGGANNVAVGDTAGSAINSGVSNVCIGLESGSSITTGNNNVCIGPHAGQGQFSTTNYNLFIARGAAGAGNAAVWILGSSTGACNQGNNNSAWTTVSDERIKKDIVDSPNGLAKIDALQVRDFNYRTEEEITAEGLTGCDAVGLQTGVIAQEIELVLPKAVTENEAGLKQVSTDPIFWAMLKAIQELSAKNDALETRITALEG